MDMSNFSEKKTFHPNIKIKLQDTYIRLALYKLTSCGCISTYNGKTIRHLTTRFEEYKRDDSPKGIHTPVWEGSDHRTVELGDKRSVKQRIGSAAQSFQFGLMLVAAS